MLNSWPETILSVLVGAIIFCWMVFSALPHASMPGVLFVYAVGAALMLGLIGWRLYAGLIEPWTARIGFWFGILLWAAMCSSLPVHH
jgi:hypothetical protein